MKQRLQLLLLLLMIGLPGAKAAVMGTSENLQGGSPPSGQSTPNKNASNNTNPVTNALSPTALPSPSSQMSQTGQVGSQQVQLPKDLSKLTPEQTNELIKQTKNLNPEQLQAIAKTIQTQSQPHQQPENLQNIPMGPPTTAGNVKQVASTASFSPEQRSAEFEEMKREAAFNSLMEDVLPLSPEQITRLHKFYDLTLQAKATPPTAPPNPSFTSVVVNLDPGSQPPVIRLAAGFVTSILFVDSTGSAWPITAYSIGDPQIFNIQWDQKATPCLSKV